MLKTYKRLRIAACMLDWLQLASLGDTLSYRICFKLLHAIFLIWGVPFVVFKFCWVVSLVRHGILLRPISYFFCPLTVCFIDGVYSSLLILSHCQLCIFVPDVQRPALPSCFVVVVIVSLARLFQNFRISNLVFPVYAPTFGKP